MKDTCKPIVRGILEIEVIAKEMQENTIEMSKLDDEISFSLGFCLNLAEIWQLGN